MACLSLLCRPSLSSLYISFSSTKFSSTNFSCEFSPALKNSTCGIALKTGKNLRWKNPSQKCSTINSSASPDVGTEQKASGALNYKHIMVPVVDKNPYLSEATRQTIATATSMAKSFGAEITVVVIDEDQAETMDAHEQRMKSIRWHLGEGGYEEFGLLERLGEGKMPAALVGEVADDMNLDLVILSMETIHSKHMDGNLLAEFVPCPILMLPL